MPWLGGFFLPRPGARASLAPVPTPAIVIHSLAHAEAALAAAAEADVPVTLLSAPGAAGTVGPAWFAAVIARAAAAHPTARFTAALDCGDAPGLALAALRTGLTTLSLDASPRARTKVAEIAAAQGAALIERPRRALDLLDAPDPAAACRDFLAA